ncbi:MAG: lipid-A-disaccharide synthase N-terminal domain-containing protein [Deltaproteobacteria bacterium]|nr:lipid-A-disaccharide synthase N-terminal domain-containing protein [Deltaproteobacteria bacterium]MBW1984683.1 lipid-A-disaccharide synthase N-terminal domain-containing protein [Deltaproteobacteria bacterium]MBW2179402.1 lipid-A-disaccharide synthase N-terminal domain-containing protein [Deltaproteobacteria bacterium]MBW2364708.1 lipid-A-disaccharide synthase N-terminal domain-containing protein [Deltaproteobacteria bacterium]
MHTFWLVLGFSAQALFTARFLVQWIASEKAGKSVVPLFFWYFSLVGSSLLLIYSIYRKDPVFIIGQSTGIFIYVRNLYFIKREKRNVGQSPIGLEQNSTI